MLVEFGIGAAIRPDKTIDLLLKYGDKTAQLDGIGEIGLDPETLTMAQKNYIAAVFFGAIVSGAQIYEQNPTFEAWGEALKELGSNEEPCLEAFERAKLQYLTLRALLGNQFYAVTNSVLQQSIQQLSGLEEKGR